MAATHNYASMFVLVVFKRKCTLVIHVDYRVGQKSDTSTNYITLYERYHFLAHPVYSPTDKRTPDHYIIVLNY